MEEILITIDKGGNVSVEGKGFVGTECEKLTAGLEEALGDVTKKTLKPEYRQTKSSARTVAK